MRSGSIIKRLIYQILFWTAFLLVNLLGGVEEAGDLTKEIVSTLIFTLVTMVVVYFNVLFIIPRFLYKKRYLLYILLFILSILLVTLLGYSTFELSIIDIVVETVEIAIWVGGLSSVWIIIEQLSIKEKLIIAEKKQTEDSLRYLKAQINPHFLFNVLNNINFLIHKDSDRASETVIKLSDMLRYQIYDADTDHIEINKEVKHIRNYIELERIRMGDRLQLTESYNVSNGTQLLPPFLLMPLIENAFKHSSGRGKSVISIALHTNSELVQITVENSVPEQVDNKKKEGGLGISNLKRRLELQFKDKYSYTYGVVDNSYKAELVIKLI